MYNPTLAEVKPLSRSTTLQGIVAALRARITAANLVGLLGALLAIVCLLALPQPWNMRLPLYLTVTIWTLLRPRTALYLLPFAVPWGSLDSINLGGLNVTSNDILVGLLTASWLMSFTLRYWLSGSQAAEGPLDQGSPNVAGYLIYATLLLLLVMLVSMIGAFSVKTSLKEIVKWLEVLVIILLGARYLRTRQQIWTLIVLIFLAAVSQALYGYFQYFFNLGPQAFVRSAALRVYGTFDQPNPYAGYINMSLTIAIALTVLGRNWATRIFAGTVMVLLGVTEYLSQSRGGEIAIAVALLFIFTLGIRRLRPLMAAGVIAALGIVAGYLGGVVPTRLLNPVLRVLGLVSISFSSPSAEDFSTAERLAHWIAGIKMFVDHPFTGVGIGNYPDAYPQYYITIFVNSLGHAHNYYINIAAEMGLIGLTAFLLFLVAVFVAGAQSYRVLSKKRLQVKIQRANPKAGISEAEARRSLNLLGILTNDRALGIGLMAALLSVCVHNLVDDLYVHSMTILFALLLIALIRLKDVAPKVASNRG